MSDTYEVLLHFMGAKPVPPASANTTNGPVSSTFNIGPNVTPDSGTFVTDPSRMIDWRCYFSFLPGLEDMKRAIKRQKCMNAGDDGHMSLLVKSIMWPTAHMQPGDSIQLRPMDEIKPFLPLAYVQITRLQVIHMSAGVVDLIVKTEKQRHEKEKKEAIPGGEVPPEVQGEDGPTY